jgi:trimeric autotransporter adhesin
MKHLIFLFICIACISNSGDAQIISTVAGGGTDAAGDGGAATNALLKSPTGVAVDAAGNIYVCERDAHCVRKVGTDGIITTVAGTGIAGYSGDGGAATDARLNRPYSIVTDAGGNIYFSEGDNHCIRRVNVAGIISTIAGTGSAGYNGDGIMASAAQLNGPSGIAIDAANNMYIADFENNRIRKIDNAGIITTVAGTGITLFNGDNLPATNASLWAPAGVAVDNTNSIYITDFYHQRIRKVDPAGIITTIAGDGTTGFSGDGNAATTAQLRNPMGICTDGHGNVFFSDVLNRRVRKVNSSGVISTVAGNGLSGGFSGDGGLATSAGVAPLGLAFDNAGNLLACDYPVSISRVRRISNVVAVKAIQASSLNNVIVFPNPCNGRCKVQVSSNDSRDLTVLITDILGRRVAELTGKTNSEVVIEPDVPDGIYIVTVMSGNERTTEKLSVVR